MRAIWAPASRHHCAPLRCARKRATLGYERTRDVSGTHTQPCRRLGSNGLLMTKYFSKADIFTALFPSPNSCQVCEPSKTPQSPVAEGFRQLRVGDSSTRFQEDPENRATG